MRPAGGNTQELHPAVLAFLRDTKVVRMVALAPSEEEGLEEIELFPQEEGEEAEGEEEGGPVRPRVYFPLVTCAYFFVILFVSFLCLFF